MSTNRRRIAYRVGSSQRGVVRNVCGVVTSSDDDFYVTNNELQGGAGTNRPNWRAVIASRGDATNPWSADFFTCRNGNGYAYATRLVNQVLPGCGQGTHYTNDVHNGFMASPNAFVTLLTVMPETVRNAAIGRFVSKARQAMSPFQGGVFLGELREAIRMIRNPASTLFRSITRSYPATATKRIRAIKTRRVPPGKRVSAATRVVADTWLEYSFGWTPLISDVKSGAEALARLLNYPYPLERVSAGASANEPGPTNLGLDGLYSYGLSAWRIRGSRETHEYSYRLHGGLRHASMGSASNAQTLASMNWTDVLPTVWELIPYSFLVDYFTNVGDVISAATFCRSDLTFISGSGKMTRRLTIGGVQNASATPASGAGGQESELTAVRIFREPSPSLVPSLQFECPGVGSMKWLNIGALIGARAAGRGALFGTD
jgi:hypothetical protein